MKHFIIGHQKPDLDATVAPIALAAYFKMIGDDTGTPVICDPINPETEFVFKKFGVTAPELITADQITAVDRVLLVDHNETDQRLPNLNPDLISGIIDHHKCNLDLVNPITIDIKPWGSTNTIVYFKYKNRGLQIDKTIAAIMLSAILSDTVGLKSATTTDKDKEAVTALAQIAGIADIPSLTLEIFKAKSNLSALTPEQIVKNDYKVFEFKKKTYIGQIETVEQDVVLSTRKEELLTAMQQVKSSEGVELLFLAVSDVLKVNTKLLILGDEEKKVAELAFGGVATDNVLDIGAKLSRKKEIAPLIETALNG